MQQRAGGKAMAAPLCLHLRVRSSHQPSEQSHDIWRTGFFLPPPPQAGFHTSVQAPAGSRARLHASGREARWAGTTVLRAEIDQHEPQFTHRKRCPAQARGQEGFLGETVLGQEKLYKFSKAAAGHPLDLLQINESFFRISQILSGTHISSHQG